MEEENEYIELPDDPEEAFAALQRRKYKSLEQAWEDNRNGSWHLEHKYVDTLLAFDEVHSLGILTEFRNPPNDDLKFSDFFQDFRRDAEIASQKIMMEAARRMKTGASTIVILVYSRCSGENGYPYINRKNPGKAERTQITGKQERFPFQ
jgi:hypothetical protein